MTATRLPTRRELLRFIPVVERELLATRSTTWTTVLSGFVEPVFYLLAFGVGLGSYIGTVDAAGAEVPYLSYVAPALLAVSSMNAAVFDSTWNVFFKMHYGGLYRSMLASALDTTDVALGQIAYSLLRSTLYACGFGIVMIVAGVDLAWSALLCLPVVLLISFAFASAGMAATTFLSSYQRLEWIDLVVLPMVMFSATFVPLHVFPPAVEAAARALPLWHGVELMRGVVLGTFRSGMLWNAAYLTLLAVVGLVITSARMRRLFRR